MISSSFKFWIGEDGVARVRKEDMPRPMGKPSRIRGRVPICAS